MPRGTFISDWVRDEGLSTLIECDNNGCTLPYGGSERTLMLPPHGCWTQEPQGGQETIKAMAKLFYSELNAEQIYLEMIKRFPAIEYQQDPLSMFYIFGKGWRQLDEDAREQAEVWFRKVISEKHLKGIKYEDMGDGEYLYLKFLT